MVLRGVATILVVVIHTTHWPASAPLFIDLDLLARLAVPAFMLLTGVLLSYRYGSTRVNVGEFLRRRFSRSLIPWLAWAPVYTLTGVLLTGNVAQDGGVVSFLLYGAGHLWFLLLIPQMYLVYLVWPRQRLWVWAAVALIAQTALSIYRLYGPMPDGAVEQLTLWHGFQLLPFWIGYFAVGLAAGRSLADRGEPGRMRWLPVGGATVAVALSGWLLIAVSYAGAPHAIFARGTGGFLLPQEPLFVLSVATLIWLTGRAVMSRSGVLAKGITLLSDNSLGVYILHPLLIFEMGRQLIGPLNAAFPESFATFLLLTAVGLLASLLASILLSATPVAITLGIRRRTAR